MKPIIYISPERLALWKKNCPLHYRELIELLEIQAAHKDCRLTPEELYQACSRTLSLLIYMFDLCCRTERARQRMRKSFRELVANPITNAINRGLQQRLGEHAGWVRQGIEEPDPDEIEGGCDGNA